MFLCLENLVFDSTEMTYDYRDAKDNVTNRQCDFEENACNRQ